MQTGDNPGLAARLLLWQWARIGKGGPRTWVDAGYCIDAPETLAAGSTVRDEYGREIDDWMVMPSMVERVSSNAPVTGRPPAKGGESDELGEHDGR